MFAPSLFDSCLQFGRDGEVVIVDGDEGVGLALAADKDAFTGINLVNDDAILLRKSLTVSVYMVLMCF